MSKRFTRIAFCDADFLTQEGTTNRSLLPLLFFAFSGFVASKTSQVGTGGLTNSLAKQKIVMQDLMSMPEF